MTVDILEAEGGVVFDLPGTDPHTHVLVIGAGEYPNFQGGQTADVGAPLGQLSSPPTSARALASWFLSEYNYPDAPIGSVALLISEPSPAQFIHNNRRWALPTPTYAAFSEAVMAWFDRGNNNEANRMIFVFCGHGYGNARETSLLMSDFDFRRRDRWDSALDLGKFVEGMSACQAAEQLYLIDACRRPHGDLLAPRAAIGRSPIQPVESPRGGLQSRVNAPLLFSTGANEPARGRPKGLSIFTEAFFRAVRGMGARDDEGDWMVNTFTLLDAINFMAMRLTEKDFPDAQQPQATEGRRLNFHYLNRAPVTPIYITRADQSPCGPGTLHYEVRGRSKRRSCTAKDFEIEVEVPLGDYNFEVTSRDRPTVKAQRASGPIYKKVKLT